MNHSLAPSRLARTKFALPSLVTLLSIACGFTSIIVTVNNTSAGAACVASIVVGWPEPAHTLAEAWRVVALLIATGTLMVSALRFPSTKQGRPRSATAIASIVAVLSLATWIAATLGLRFFAAFFAMYVTATLSLNFAWRAGWCSIEPPRRY